MELNSEKLVEALTYLRKGICITMTLLMILIVLTSCGSEQGEPEGTASQETVSYDRELADEIQNKVIENIDHCDYNDDISVTVRQKSEISEVEINITPGYSRWQVWECFKAIYPYMKNYSGEFTLTVCVLIDPNGDTRIVKFDTSDLKTGTLFSNENNLFRSGTTIAELYEYCNWGTIGEHTNETFELG